MINQAIDMSRVIKTPRKRKNEFNLDDKWDTTPRKRKRGNNQTEGYYQKKLEMKQFKQYKPSFYKKMVCQINFCYFKIY